jgi:pyruvate/2-oxoglutarate dehydrogenase complex dihydrolipoamide acyltransferase (E2) component
MAVTVVMPRVGKTMTEGTIVRWEKNVGDLVRKGEVLARIETDVAEADIVATEEGYLLKIDADPEQIVACGEPVAWLGGQGEKP